MRFGFLTAAFTACVLACAAHAAVVEEFRAEDWDGRAFTDDSTGLFSHCAVYASYRNGSTLYISFEVSESWYLSVSNESWALAEGDSYEIKFKIDRRGEIEGTGGALATDQIGLPVENDHPFIGQLRRGNQLTITFQDQDYAFELSNSNKAMNAAQDCVRRHVAAGTRTPPTSGGEQQAVGSSSGPEATQAPTEAESDSAAPESDDAVASADEQTFGSWVVAATNDSAGSFVNCTAFGMQGDDQLILSYFPDGIWTFGLYRAAWNLDTSQNYNFSYNVDAEANVEGVTARTVQVSEPTRIFFEVSRTDNIINRIEAGRTLYIRLGGPSGLVETYSYPLDQAHAAFTAARKCAAEHGPIAEPAVVDDATAPEAPVTVASPSPTETDLPTANPLGNLDAQSLGRRVALVIGNSSYGAVGMLPNPTRDASALAEALRQLGFANVTLLTDLSKGAMERALIDFADEAQGADWALVYFGGHGLEMEGENYLVPIDAQLKQDRHVKLEAISLDEVLDTVRGAKTLQLVILDACRDNPFLQQMTRTLSTRSVSRGLARIEPTGAELVVFAARDGQVAMDGDGENSPLVTALLQHLEEPGVEINLLFRKVRDSVMAATNNAQQPFTYGSLPGTELYFVPSR
jgi:hypothetical protein